MGSHAIAVGNQITKQYHQAEECWCKDLDCRSCGKKGHIERACKNKNRQSNKSTEQRKSDLKEYKKKVHKMEHTEDEQSDTLSEGEESLHVLSISDNEYGYWLTWKRSTDSSGHWRSHIFAV